MKPTPAPCLKKFLADATQRWPRRNRESDGIMPSAEHTKANPTSDHELGNAGDLTHDPGSGANCNVLAAQLVGSKDRRIKYIIWNRFIWFPAAGKRPEGWSGYKGSNPHTRHIHVSIKPESRNDLSPWPWSLEANTRPMACLESELRIQLSISKGKKD